MKKDQDSMNFATMHTKALYNGSPKLKIGNDKFKDNSYYAHLIGRAFCCEKILEQHKAEPYDSIDLLIGDLQIELTNALNNFRDKTMYHRSDRYKVEQFL